MTDKTKIKQIDMSLLNCQATSISNMLFIESNEVKRIALKYNVIEYKDILNAMKREFFDMRYKIDRLLTY